MRFEDSEPCYVISVAAKMVGVHAQTLRYYERVGLIEPSRSQGNIRLYSARDIDKLRQMKSLIDDLGVNLAGVEVIFRMAGRLMDMEQTMRQMELELKELRENNSG